MPPPLATLPPANGQAQNRVSVLTPSQLYYALSFLQEILV